MININAEKLKIERIANFKNMAHRFWEKRRGNCNLRSHVRSNGKKQRGTLFFSMYWLGEKGRNYLGRPTYSRWGYYWPQHSCYWPLSSFQIKKKTPFPTMHNVNTFSLHWWGEKTFCNGIGIPWFCCAFFRTLISAMEVYFCCITKFVEKMHNEITILLCK